MTIGQNAKAQQIIGAFISLHLKLYSKFIALLQYRDCNKR